MNRPIDESAALLAELAGLGIEVKASGDRLRFRPRSAMTSDLVERLTTHKLKVLAILRDGQRGDGDTGDEADNGPPIRYTPEATTKDRAITRAIASVDRKPTPPDPAGPCPVKIPEGWRPDRWAVELRVKADSCDELHAETADQWRDTAHRIELWLGRAQGYDGSFNFGQNTKKD